MTQKKPTLFDVLSPGKTFAGGFITALLVFFSIGFFVLLFRGGGIDLGKKSKTTFGTPTTGQVANTGGAAQPAAGNQPAAAAAVNVAQVTSDDHVRGDLEKAEVVLVEYSDLDCPFCATHHPTMQQALDEYGDKVAWVYRHFPLRSIHPNAQAKAEASECVASLGGNEAFWTFIDTLFDRSRGQIQLSQMGDIAAEVGVDSGAFQNCLDAGTHKDVVDAQYLDATSNGGRGTPYTVIIPREGDSVPLSGAVPYDQIKPVIDSFLQ